MKKKGANSINAIAMKQMALAVMKNDHDAIKRLVAKGYDLNANAKGEPFPEPLSFAIVRGTADMIRLMLELGADPNIPGAVLDGEARSVFHCACACLDESIGQMTPEHIYELLRGGAQVDEESYALQKLPQSVRDNIFAIASQAPQSTSAPSAPAPSR
jgi:hypothetical protein